MTIQKGWIGSKFVVAAVNPQFFSFTNWYINRSFGSFLPKPFCGKGHNENSSEKRMNYEFTKFSSSNYSFRCLLLLEAWPTNDAGQVVS